MNAPPWDLLLLDCRLATLAEGTLPYGAVHRAALGGRAGDPGAADAEVSAVREAARLIAEDERLTPVLVPLGDGILVAARD